MRAIGTDDHACHVSRAEHKGHISCCDFGARFHGGGQHREMAFDRRPKIPKKIASGPLFQGSFFAIAANNDSTRTFTDAMMHYHVLI